jgi:hypothetical protein
MVAGMQREPCQQLAGAARSRLLAGLSLDFEVEAADQADAQHRRSVFAGFALR